MRRKTRYLATLALVAALAAAPAAAAAGGSVGAFEGFVTHVDAETRLLLVETRRFQVPARLDAFDELRGGERVLVDYELVGGTRVVTRLFTDLPAD